jgi:hypothetical protein
MAIKGKTKSRTRRVVAVPPRPPVYVRKPPVWRRRTVIVSVAALVALVTLVLVVTSVRSGNRKALKNRTLAAVSRLQSDLEALFPPPPGSQASPPTGFVIYPTLSSDLDNVASGKLAAADAVKKAKSLTTSAKTSGDAIQKLLVTNVIAEEASVGPVASVRGRGATRLELNDGKIMITEAFRVWESVGGLMQEAANLTGKDRQAVVDRAKELANEAATLFRDGYQKFINVKAQLTTLVPNSFPQVPGGGLGGP